MPRPLAALVCAAALACSARSTPSVEPSARPDTAAPAAAPAEASPTPPPDPREARLAAGVVALLENHHLRKQRIDDALSREAFKTYLERLDPTKMFLLQEDATALGRHADRIDDQLRGGNLELAHDGQGRFAARVAVVEKMVAELLATPLDLGDDEHFEVDPEKVELASSDAELRDRWRRRLELEVLERVTAMEDRLERRAKRTLKDGRPPHPPVPPAGDLPPGVPPDEEPGDPAGAPGEIPATPEAREAKARADLAVAYAGRFARLRTPRPLNAAAALINAVAATYDPHTDYLPPSDKANFDIQMSGALEGIGARLRERDHYIEVAEVVPGGASWRQGKLTVGDLILSVASPGAAPVDVTDMPIDDVVKMIRGPKGTVVTLRIRKASGEEETLSIVRDKVVIEEAYARGAVLTPGGARGRSYGYIYLPSFYGGQGSERNAAGDVRRLLAQLRQLEVAGVIIDVRSNGGGLLNAAVDITGELIDAGPVVQVQDSRGRREVLGDEDAGTSFDGPVVVMIDRFSASASEIVAGALKDYKRAVVVGTGPTHGKGTVQTVADLDRLTGSEVALNENELGAMKVTVQQFFRVNGASTQLQGVAPDILLPDAMGFLETGERELDHAIPWSQIEAVPFTPVNGGWRLETLAARSAARVAKEPLFAKITQRSQLLRAWRDDTVAPLSRAAFAARQKDHRAKLEATALDLEKAPPRFGVKLVEDPRSKLAVPGPNGRVDDRPARWRDQLSRDPWVGESLAVLADMASRR